MKQWLSINWRWLLILPFAIAAALYFSFGRLTQVYWNEHSTAAITALPSVEGPTAHYTSTLVNSGNTYERVIDVTFLGTRPLDSHPDIKPVAGATLWAFDFSFSADPSVIASGCRISALDAEGRRYFQGAATLRNPTSKSLKPMDCVPVGAEGPTVDVFSGNLVESATARPATWKNSLVLAIPDGVTPATVQLAWDLPNYAEFDIPQQ